MYNICMVYNSYMKVECFNYLFWCYFIIFLFLIVNNVGFVFILMFFVLLMRIIYLYLVIIVGIRDEEYGFNCVGR